MTPSKREERDSRERAREHLYPKIVDDKLLTEWMWREIDKLAALLDEAEARGVVWCVDRLKDAGYLDIAQQLEVVIEQLEAQIKVERAALADSAGSDTGAGETGEPKLVHTAGQYPASVLAAAPDSAKVGTPKTLVTTIVRQVWNCVDYDSEGRPWLDKVKAEAKVRAALGKEKGTA